MNSKDKGRRGEAELARKLREYGYDCYRSQQYCGANGDADIEGIPGIHAECKRTEKFALYDALDQAKRDTKGGKPTVFHRKNNHEWVVVMRLEDWIELYREWEVHE